MKWLRRRVHLDFPSQKNRFSITDLSCRSAVEQNNRSVERSNRTMVSEISKIQDYAIIGDSRSAALVSKRGSIDWLCWPRFDSPSVFGAIIDPDLGGYWSIRPTKDFQVSRRYVDKTNVLETTFTNGSARIVLIDFMAVTSEDTKHGLLWPEHELIRQIRCEHGEAELVVEFNPRLDYGRIIPKIRNFGRFGRRIEFDGKIFTLRNEVELVWLNRTSSAIAWEDCWATKFLMKAGESVAFSFSFSGEAPGVIPPLGDFVAEKLRLTIDWWQKWAARSTYRGPYERQVTRSALVLKLLSYAPSGAIVAAPTTSLPERIGGDLNWDYRFCWVRDAALTVASLSDLGYDDEASAFLDWLLHSTRLTRPALRVLYDVHGGVPEAETTLDHLAGHLGSRPVRVRNAAAGQLQLDGYGELVAAVAEM